MSRLFTNSEAKNLLQETQELTQRIYGMIDSQEQYIQNVRKAGEQLIRQEVLKVLKDISIDAVNRDKRGIRVKAMRDEGYENFADIADASVYAIASVKGISEETARMIRQMVDEVAEKTRKEVKVSLSTDHKTEETSALILALYRYDQASTLTGACKNLLTEQQQTIDSAQEELRSSLGLIKWVFLSKEKKQKAESAFRVLSTLVTGEFSRQINGIMQKLNAINYCDSVEAWSQFEKNPIRYISHLEEISPELLIKDESVYGLPEDLAEAVRNEPFYPKGLTCTLRRYQELGVKYILHQKRVLLGDEMGLGKTIQAIASMVSLRNTGATHFLVVCPASVMTNWCREIAKMSDLNVCKIHGSDRLSALNYWIKSGGVAVTTFETTTLFFLPQEFTYTMLVVDEAHYIKNPNAHRTYAVKRLGNQAERLLFMTGTALENKVDEMVELMKILQPETAKHADRIAFLLSAPQFRETIAPVYYRRKREEVLAELPELIDNREWCTLNAKEQLLYEQSLYSKNFAEIRRVSWNVADLKDSSKAARLLEIIEDAENDGRKIIVFSFFLETIRKIALLLEGRCVGPITGKVSPQKRQELLDEFEKAPAGTVLVAQIQSGGTGLNIQSASVVVLCEPQFKPSIENQAISRAYRMGQTRNVLVYRLLADDTVDERITEILEQKQTLFDAFADESVIAAEHLEMDEKSFDGLIQDEIDKLQERKETL